MIFNRTKHVVVPPTPQLTGQTCTISNCSKVATKICNLRPVGEVLYLCDNHPDVCLWVGGNPSTRSGCFGCIFSPIEGNAMDIIKRYDKLVVEGSRADIVVILKKIRVEAYKSKVIDYDPFVIIDLADQIETLLNRLETEQQLSEWREQDKT